jgi:hypothetical protein
MSTFDRLKKFFPVWGTLTLDFLHSQHLKSHPVRKQQVPKWLTNYHIQANLEIELVAFLDSYPKRMPRNLSLDFFLGICKIQKPKTAIFLCKFNQIFSKHSQTERKHMW